MKNLPIVVVALFLAVSIVVISDYPPLLPQIPQPVLLASLKPATSTPPEPQPVISVLKEKRDCEKAEGDFHIHPAYSVTMIGGSQYITPDNYDLVCSMPAPKDLFDYTISAN